MRLVELIKTDQVIEETSIDAAIHSSRQSVMDMSLHDTLPPGIAEDAAEAIQAVLSLAGLPDVTDADNQPFTSTDAAALPVPPALRSRSASVGPEQDVAHPLATSSPVPGDDSEQLRGDSEA